MARDIGEFTSYITPDGEVYPFDVPSTEGRWLLTQSGWGTPPINYITQRGPSQHGETVRDFFLRPRLIQLLIRQQFCDRDDYWSGRAGLLDAIRPNRQLTPTASEPGQLRRITSDGSIRDLNVFLTEGPRFRLREPGKWDEWAFQEVLRFIAHDPVIFDPTRVDIVLGFDEDANLVFPIVFPIVFGDDDIDDTVNVAYTGTWETFPVIVVTGPLNDFKIVNNDTGEEIEVTFDIAPGDSLTIDLRYGFKTIVDGSGINRIGALTAESDLATWHIAPDPEAPGGINSLTVTGTNAHPGTTQVEVRYFTRYFGI